MARPRRRHPAVAGIDEAALAEFRAGIRRRYTDEQILEQLRASAERLGRSPTMREFAADAEAEVHPQTVIEHFGTWNAAKRAAGLTPRRFISREELLAQLQRLGEELGRTPTARDLDANRRRVASKSLIWHTFGSLSAALREAGFDVPSATRGSSGRSPRARCWRAARSPAADGRLEGGPARRSELLSEWQVYRLVDIDVGPWAAFQYLVRERLREEGVTCGPTARSRQSDSASLARQRGDSVPAARERQAGAVVAVAAVGAEALLGRDPPALELEHAALGHLLLAERQPQRALDDLEGGLRRGEEDLPAAPADPERSGDPAGEVEAPAARSSIQAAAIEPRSSSSAASGRSGSGMSAKIASESTVMPASACAIPCRSKIASSLRMTPLWIPTTDPWRMGWLLASSVGWPFV